jgi:hypothetical protein
VLAEAVRDFFSPLTPGELLGDIGTSKTVDERAHAVVRAGLGAPGEFDNRFYVQIKSTMESAESKIREAGAWAESLTRWQEFQQLLEGIGSGDPSRA